MADVAAVDLVEVMKVRRHPELPTEDSEAILHGGIKGAVNLPKGMVVLMERGALFLRRGKLVMTWRLAGADVLSTVLDLGLLGDQLVDRLHQATTHTPSDPDRLRELLKKKGSFVVPYSEIVEVTLSWPAKPKGMQQQLSQRPNTMVLTQETAAGSTRQHELIVGSLVAPQGSREQTVPLAQAIAAERFRSQLEASTADPTRGRAWIADFSGCDVVRSTWSELFPEAPST